MSELNDIAFNNVQTLRERGGWCFVARVILAPLATLFYATQSDHMCLFCLSLLNLLLIGISMAVDLSKYFPKKD